MDQDDDQIEDDDIDKDGALGSNSAWLEGGMLLQNRQRLQSGRES